LLINQFFIPINSSHRFNAEKRICHFVQLAQRRPGQPIPPAQNCAIDVFLPPPDFKNDRYLYATFIAYTMQENKYDDNLFFERYAQMERSQKGLAGAGEWPAFQQLLPDFKGQDVLDLGCGYGWHCRYAAEHGARAVLGVDL